jgi:tetratricopeptide (TPR) repeat protein
MKASSALNRPALVALAGGLFLCAAFLWWLCRWDNQIPFLPAARPAEWIVYPRPPDTLPHQAAPVVAVFRRAFELPTAPSSVKLSVRAFKEGKVSLNGQPVEALRLTPQDWKQVRACEAAKFLHAGQNEISVTVSNSLGPPALWLALEADSRIVASDHEWQVSLLGAAWQNAALASDPLSIRPGNYLFGRETIKDSLRQSWPSLLVILFIAVAIVAIIPRLQNNCRSRRKEALFEGEGGGLAWEQVRASLRRLLQSLESDPPRAVLLLIVLSWIVLFSNNLPQLAHLLGFDRDGHQQYIDYLLEKKALPLADEGWQMYQPPLFYFLSAMLLGPLGLSASGDAGLMVLRVVSMATGLVHLLLLFKCLRLLFPRQHAQQIVGLVFAGFLPANLYLSHHVTNESLGALFVTAAFYFCLRILSTVQSPESTVHSRDHVAVGLCLGLALLTKFSALLALPFIFAALLWEGVRRQETGDGSASPSSRIQNPESGITQHAIRNTQHVPPFTFHSTRPILLALAACLLVCGWHYTRVWLHFGNPLIGNWDPRLPFAWWQEPGCHTTGWCVRFGQALVCPALSSLASFADGVYSSLWGDGLWSGGARMSFRPQWNFDLMNTGYLLALLWTALLLLGAGRALLGLIRQPDPEAFLFLGTVFAFLFGMLFMSLRVASFAQVKAFYALPVLLPVCALAVRGWELLAKRGPPLRAALWVGILSWAFTSYASLWIRPANPVTHIMRGVGFVDDARLPEAIAEFSRALQLNATSLAARVGLADVLNRLGRRDEARQQASLALQQHPDAPEAQIQSAVISAHDGHYAEAVALLRQALATSPDHPTACQTLAVCLAQLGQHQQAIDACEQGLRINPFSPQLHYLLAVTLATQGKVREAADQYQQVLALQPDMIEALNNLAWIRAASSTDDLRNGHGAVRLAERACELTQRREPLFLGTLAAAYAEAGRFQDAVATAEKALALATAAGQKEVAEKNRQLLELYRSAKPYHEPPPATR